MIHGKFVGRVTQTPEKYGPKKYGFATLSATTLDGSGSGRVTTVNALLDPKVLNRKEAAKDALKWNAGDLVQLEGEVVNTQTCKCRGKPIIVVDAFKCDRITGTA
jgi:lysyl-tRNA synthetase class II